MVQNIEFVEYPYQQENLAYGENCHNENIYLE